MDEQKQFFLSINFLSANPTWSNTLRQFDGNLLTNCLTVLDYFVGLGLKVLRLTISICLSYFY